MGQTKLLLCKFANKGRTLQIKTASCLDLVGSRPLAVQESGRRDCATNCTTSFVEKNSATMLMSLPTLILLL